MHSQAIEREVYSLLERTQEYVSERELANQLKDFELSEIRDSLIELGNRVIQNESGDWNSASTLISVEGRLASILSESEKAEREELEKVIDESFYRAGVSLGILRDKKLYRDAHSTFEEYISDRFGRTPRWAYYLIEASEVYGFLKQDETIAVLPNSQRQCREIARLPKHQWGEAWRSGIEQNNDKIPSGTILKEIVTEMNCQTLELKNNKKPETKIVNTPGLGNEYVVYLEESTFRLVKEFQSLIGTANMNGAIRRAVEAQIEQISSN